jgi:hypothetical protein
LSIDNEGGVVLGSRRVPERPTTSDEVKSRRGLSQESTGSQFRFGDWRIDSTNFCEMGCVTVAVAAKNAVMVGMVICDTNIKYINCIEFIKIVLSTHGEDTG